MKKIYSCLLLFVASAAIKAASYTITIVGTSYAPNTLTVNVGDVVTIEANGTHPLVQVDQPTWAANGSTPMSGGWGTKTSNHTFTVTNAGDIYFVCSVHVGMGMKGMITANSTAGLSQASLNFGEVAVFPNPASEKINVKLNSPSQTEITMSLYSLNGQLIMTAEKTLSAGENTITLDLPVLSAGNYILQVNSENGKITRQISVTK